MLCKAFIDALEVLRIINYLGQIDELVARKGFMSRSDLILTAVRYYMDRVTYREEYLQNMQDRGMIKKIPPPPEEEEP